MNPSTGTFITMDEYVGSIFEPVSLHKYLYANANPVMYSDPTGYVTARDMQVASACTLILAGTALAACGVYMNSVSFANSTLTFGTQLSLPEIQSFCEGLLSGVTTSLIVVKETVETLIGELQILVDKQIKDKTEPIYTVYTLVDSKGNVRYVGRTKYYSTRITAHASPESKNKDLIPGSKIEHLTYAQARALEQTLMVHCHTRNWLNEVGNNSINGISPNNGNKTEYFKSLEELFKNEYLENQIDNEFLNLVENNSLLY